MEPEHVGDAEAVLEAFANSVVQMAFDMKVMSASNSVVYKKKLPIAGEVGRRFMAK